MSRVLAGVNPEADLNRVTSDRRSREVTSASPESDCLAIPTLHVELDYIAVGTSRRHRWGLRVVGVPEVG